jgi:hypothetical protein
MKKYEYRSHTCHSSIIQLIGDLNDLGAEGWECFSVTSNNSIGIYGTYTVLLKREITG